MTDQIEAERQLIELVRGLDERGDFNVVISRKSGRWYVATKTPDREGAEGDGATFAEAWMRQSPNWS